MERRVVCEVVMERGRRRRASFAAARMTLNNQFSLHVVNEAQSHPQGIYARILLAEKHFHAFPARRDITFHEF